MEERYGSSLAMRAQGGGAPLKIKFRRKKSLVMMGKEWIINRHPQQRPSKMGPFSCPLVALRVILPHLRS